MNIVRILFLMLIIAPYLGQEICNNGIDDDADGLIDYNDILDCECSGFGSSQSVPSLIPNSSFENNSCCPTSYSQLGCADTWIQASVPTSDYWHSCGTPFSLDYGSPGPYPDGNGIAGFLNWDGYKEYVGACLLMPMTAGNTYVLDFWLGFGTTSVPIDITFYGTNNCGDLPFGVGCPVGQGGWTQLSSVTSSGPGWQNLQVTFTPTVDINALVIGPPCALGPPSPNYYYLDGLTLAETGAFVSSTIDETGGLCTNDDLLTASSDTLGGLWQWYLDDIALIGETGSVLDISGGGYGAGNYSVVYTIGNKCDKVDYTIVPEDYPEVGFISDIVCEGMVTSFTDTSSIGGGAIINNWSWDFDGDNLEDLASQNPTNIVSGTPLEATLTVTGDNGCSSFVTLPVDVHSNPISNFNFGLDTDIDGVIDGVGGATICLGNAVAFENITTDPTTVWNWNFGDGIGTSIAENPSYTYVTAGDFTVNLEVVTADGCSGTIDKVVHITENPIASFVPADVCDEEVYVFADGSISAEGIIDSWSWDFEDDGFVDANTQNTTYLYPSAGNHNVRLVVGTDLGCFDTLIQQITVLEAPIADFEFTYVCEGQPTIYSDLSTTTHGTITSWSWDFINDGVENDNVQHPSNVFGVAGAASTMLTVTTSSNCSYDTIIEIFVNPIPNVDYSWLDVCEGDAMIFSDLSSITYGNIQTWNWDFDDLTQGNSLGDTTHSYGTSGVYDVTLTVTSDSGCIDSRVQQVEVWDVPIANFAYSDVCDLSQAIFTNSSVGNGGVINSQFWDYTSDAVVDFTGIDGSFLYPTIGTFPVSLIVETQDGCRDTLVQDIVIHPNPIVQISGQNVCETFGVTFTNSSTIISGVITDWTWDFANGNTSILESPIEVYNNEGIYNVELTATSDQGCITTEIAAVEIYPTPVPQFIWADVCDGNQMSFTDFSVVSNQFTTNSVTMWDWSFGDVPAGVGGGQFPNYLYAGPGTYPVTLNIETNNGCVNSIQQNITVHPNPVISFSCPNPIGCTELCVDFVNNTSISSGVISSYLWNLGDGTVSSDQSPTQCYVNSNLVDEYYDIELTTTSDMGCQSTLNESNFVTVYPLPIADFEANKYETTLYQPEIEFTNTSLIGDTYMWDFDGLDFSTEEHFMYTFPESDSGTYVVCLEATSVNGCIDDTCKPIVITGFSSVYVPNAFTPDDDGVNDLFFPSLFGVTEKDFSFMIFDRWGLLIYETSDLLKANWDGTHNGVIVPLDTYVWKINWTDKYSHKMNEKMGHVTLIK